MFKPEYQPCFPKYILTNSAQSNSQQAIDDSSDALFPELNFLHSFRGNSQKEEIKSEC